MKFQSFRNAVVVASVIVGSVIPSQAFAEIDVLTGLSFNGFTSSACESSYTFTQAMILNSIGFVSSNKALTIISYTNGSAITNLLESDLSDVDANGLRWYTLPNGGLSVSASSVLKVNTRGYLEDPFVNPFTGDLVLDSYMTGLADVGSPNPSSNVTYGGTQSDVLQTSVTNSNLKVSALPPSGNVAPEPGTLALALTGGCALVGMVIRRRRMTNKSLPIRKHIDHLMHSEKSCPGCFLCM